MGPDFFDLSDHEVEQKVEPLTSSQVKVLRDRINLTQRPRWHAKPPHNLGEASHGKLKADQWRSLIEFDIPVALAYLAVLHPQPLHDRKRAEKRFHNTMHLALAVGIGTSRSTCKAFQERYVFHMQQYLKGLMIGNKGRKLKPNHHAALHFPSFLYLFGPVRGWWTFPFERVVGWLQNVPSNHKVGKYLSVSASILDSLFTPSRPV